jgi:hypothetical protein
VNEVNSQVGEVCEKWDARIDEFKHLDEGIPEKQCKILLRKFIDEAYQVMMEDPLKFEDSKPERQLVGDKSTELSIALKQANLKYRRKRKSFLTRLGELLPNSIFEKPY